MAICPESDCPPRPGSTTENGGSATVACPPVSFDAGNYRVKYEAGCLTKEKRPAAIPDGWYSRVRIVDGVIVEAQEESGAQVIIENPCSVQNGGEQGSVGVSIDACNLTTMDSSGLLNTRLYYSYDRFITMGGCGSPRSPLSMALDISSVRANVLAGGTNFNACGISIRDGVVLSMVNPITNIVSNNPALQISRDGCTVSLNVVAQATSVIYTRPWCQLGTGGQRIMRGTGVVLRGPGSTANVAIYVASEGITAPTPPASFQNVQEAINWLDANLTC